MPSNTVHKSVLLNEIVESLDLKGGALVLDATFGGGGHSLAILEKYPESKIVAIDQDEGAWQRAKDLFQGEKRHRINFINTNFRELSENLFDEPISFDGVIMDLGLSSDQLEVSGRGFSFMKDEPLMMTMKESPSPEELTASYIVNNFEEKNLADIIYGYGEERYSRKIAKAIVEAREEGEIKTTKELASIIESAVPAAYKRGKIHSATKTFQALRIATNDELGALNEGLKRSFEMLKKGGKLEVISFHSLEDRIVKRFMRAMKEDGLANLINKKPIVATKEETEENPRARSAKLRILEKI